MPCGTNLDFPVKNTFIHFRSEDEASSVDSASRQQDASSSSSCSRPRPASVEGRSSSSLGDAREMRWLHDKAAQWRLEKRSDLKSPSPAPPPSALPEVQEPTQAFPQSGGSSSSSAPADPRVLEVLTRIPVNGDGHLTSMGSASHEANSCSPCPFWFKGLCVHGLACRHCHFLHDGQKPRRLRPSKQSRLRMKRRSDWREGAPAPEALPSAFSLRLAAAARQQGLQVASANIEEGRSGEEEAPSSEEAPAGRSGKGMVSL